MDEEDWKPEPVEGLVRGKKPKKAEKDEPLGAPPTIYDQPTEEERKVQQLVDEIRRKELGIQKAKDTLRKIMQKPTTLGASSWIPSNQSSETVKTGVENLIDQTIRVLEGFETAEEKHRRLKELLAKHFGVKVEDLYVPRDEHEKAVQEAYQRGLTERLEDKQIEAVERIVSEAVDRVISEIFGPIIKAWYETEFSRNPPETPEKTKSETAEPSNSKQTERYPKKG